MDTITHCWEVLAEILKQVHGIIGDVGMPVLYQGVRYNCRVIFYNGEIILIRPKKWLANDGNYREMRWFTPWTREKQVVEFKLPRVIVDVIGQTKTRLGDGIISTDL